VTITNLASVAQIIAVHSAKGGVGKSTLAVNLAVGLARSGARVGLLDADVHGPSAATMLGNADWPDPGEAANAIHPLEAHGIKFISMGNLVTRETPLIWRGAIVHGVINQLFNDVLWGELEYLLIDMPPGTGDAQLTIAQSVPLAGVVSVTTPQELSLADTIRGIAAFRQLKVPLLGLVENMSFFVCDGCGDRAFLFGESAAGEIDLPLLGRIPIEPEVCDDSDRGTPFLLAHPDSAAARALNGIIDRLLPMLDRQGKYRSFDLSWRAMAWYERKPEPPPEDMAGSGPIRAIWQVSGDELGIAWRDGRKHVLSVRSLRLACPCAACVEEWSGKALLDPHSVPDNLTLREIKSVGRYAVAPVFSDGHSSGIYHFDRLQRLAEELAAG